MDASQSFLRQLEATRSGDAQAQRELYERFRGCIQAECKSINLRDNPELSATDLAQEVWLRVFQMIGQFNRLEGDGYVEVRFESWLRQTARSVLLNMVEACDAQRRKPPGAIIPLGTGGAAGKAGGGLCGAGEGGGRGPEPVAREPGPAELAARRELEAAMSAALNSKLDRVEATIIRLSFFEGESLRQVSERLGMNYESVRQRFHGALAKLHRVVEGDGWDQAVDR